MAMKKQKEIIEKLLQEQGLEPDAYGNYKFEAGGKQYRVHFKKQVVRIERKIPDLKQWFNVESFGLTNAAKFPQVFLKSYRIVSGQ